MQPALYVLVLSLPLAMTTSTARADTALPPPPADKPAREPPPKPSCDALYFDLERGTMNGVSPTASQDEIKRALPCWTGDTEEGSAFNYGGGVFFLRHDFFFYTHRDYLEVRDDFAGRTSLPLLRKSQDQVRRALGAPARTDGDAWFYRRPWGCLRVQFSRGLESEVRELGAHFGECKRPAD